MQKHSIFSGLTLYYIATRQKVEIKQQQDKIRKNNNKTKSKKTTRQNLNLTTTRQNLKKQQQDKI